ncbi:ABC transporter substrate-binding protein [Selenomonas sp. F0473]|uniref:ABC transporter substrate-binding protein n=1 Tax=Selenomonas sp. F0473 TaxID=999423 RepID=UPI00029E50D3|nr:ABC transporter substrate-binding protein [Selenomonas sp. F0473]EKU72020.1 hypothetical protein HMPREF9161_00705 [Selenomonas sp. F0473]
MKFNFRKALCAVLMAAVPLAAAGCGGSDTSADGGKKIVHVGGTVAVSTGTMDPAKEWNGWSAVRYGVGETLFRLDDALQPQPWLAEKAENLEPTVWRITLKEGVTFSNGEKMTADKVIASLKRTAELNDRAVWLKDAVFTAEGNTVTIKTKEPNATLVNDLSDPYAVILDVAGTMDFDNAPVGTGPFVMTSFEAGKSAVMEKNTKYWDGDVKVDGLEYTRIADFNTLAMALQSGEIDVALDLSPESAETIAQSDQFTVVKTPQTRTYQLYFNLDKLTEPAVREAIMYGVDKKTIGDDVLKGAMTPSGSAFLAATPFGDPALKLRSYDPEKAKAVLAAAGYADSDGDGIVEKNGKPLTVEMGVYKRLFNENITTEMQAQLKKIGINVQITAHEKANYLKPGDFEMSLYSVITMPTGDPYAFLRDVMSTQGVANFSRYNNPAVQSMLAELPNTFDFAKRVALVNRIQQQAIDDGAMDFIGFNNMQAGISKHVTGFLTTPSDYYQASKDLDKH